MVNIVNDWKEMEAYACNASRQTARAYQVIELETEDNKKTVLLRVQVGKFGFEKEYPDLNDQAFGDIIRYCSERRFLNVSKTVQDEDFFK